MIWVEVANRYAHFDNPVGHFLDLRIGERRGVFAFRRFIPFTLPKLHIASEVVIPFQIDAAAILVCPVEILLRAVSTTRPGCATNIGLCQSDQFGRLGHVGAFARPFLRRAVKVFWRHMRNVRSEQGKLRRVLLRVSARGWRVAQANRADYPRRLLRNSIDRAQGRRWACIEDWIVWHVHFEIP